MDFYWIIIFLIGIYIFFDENFFWTVFFIVGLLLFDEYVLVDGWTRKLGFPSLTYDQSQTFASIFMICFFIWIAYMFGKASK